MSKKPPVIKVDVEAFGESWHMVDMYKAVIGHLPTAEDTQTEEEIAKQFLVLWAKNPDNYSASLYFLAKKVISESRSKGGDE